MKINRFYRLRPLAIFLLFVSSIFILSACSGKTESITAQQATIDLALLQTLPKENISYDEKVKPILQNRCVVCHGCYDACTLPVKAVITSWYGAWR